MPLNPFLCKYDRGATCPLTLCYFNGYYNFYKEQNSHQRRKLLILPYFLIRKGLSMRRSLHALNRPLDVLNYSFRSTNSIFTTIQSPFTPGRSAYVEVREGFLYAGTKQNFPILFMDDHLKSFLVICLCCLMEPAELSEGG